MMLLFALVKGVIGRLRGLWGVVRRISGLEVALAMDMSMTMCGWGCDCECGGQLRSSSNAGGKRHRKQGRRVCFESASQRGCGVSR